MMPSPHLRTLCGAALCFAAPCVALGAEALCIEPWQTIAPIWLAAAAAPTDLLQSLKGQHGELPGEVTYSALRANGADGKLELTGQVDVHMGQREIQAEHATYNSDSNSIDVSGSVRYRDPIVLVAGDAGHYGEEGGLFSHARLDFLQRPGHATADQIALSAGNIVTLRAVTYTSCPQPRADWQIRARELRLDVDASRGVGRGAIVDFESVPILYLPWISFPLSNARESGLLFPNFGSSSRSGAFLGEPWYWNIAPNQDATFTPTYYSTRGLDLGGEYRLLSESNRGTIDADIMPHDTQTDSDRSYVRLIDRYQLGWNTRIDVNFENVSDDEYFEDFTQGTQSTSTPFLMRSLAAMHRDDIWDLRAELVGYQTIDDTLPVADRPYIQLPRLTAAALWSPPDWTKL
jgi:LPS-assembly protein